MRSKLLLVCAAIAVTVMLGVSSAYADQITLGDSCNGSLSVSGTVNPTVTGSVDHCEAQWEQGATSTPLGGWSITDGTSFFVGNVLNNSLAGTIDWTNALSVGGLTVLVGSINVSSVTGFSNEYMLGGDYPIDMTLRNGTPSSGEIPVPEPGTLTLLGTGLIVAAGFLRRKLGR